jgi:predicted nucleotidyltransferase
MARKRSHPGPDRWYRGADVPIAEIRRFARKVAERFHPDKIILFGSYAYGEPHEDSDVDILVVMPARNELRQALRISLAIAPPFPLDIIVRTPNKLRSKLESGSSFWSEIVSQGKVLYEKRDGGMGAKGREDLRVAETLARGSEPFHDAVCFNCRLAAPTSCSELTERTCRPLTSRIETNAAAQ